MKLIAVYADTNYVYDTYQWTGEMVKAPTRRVEVELTDEQSKALKKRFSKTSDAVKFGNKEDIIALFLEEGSGDE